MKTVLGSAGWAAVRWGEAGTGALTGVMTVRRITKMGAP